VPYIPQGSDPWVIPNPDPTRKYRWLDARPQKLGLWLRSHGSIPGYSLDRRETVDKTRAHAESLGLPADLVDANLNRISYGLNVLGSIPIEEYERRQAEHLDDQVEKLSAQEDAYHAKIDGIRGVRSFKEPIEETAERREFHTRSDRPISGQTGVGPSPNMRRVRRASASR